MFSLYCFLCVIRKWGNRKQTALSLKSRKVAVMVNWDWLMIEINLWKEKLLSNWRQVTSWTLKNFLFRDLVEAVELNRKRENHKTEQLTKHCKTILLPDRLHEAVDRRVKYVAKWVKQAKKEVFLSDCNRNKLIRKQWKAFIWQRGRNLIHCKLHNALGGNFPL